MPSSPPATIPSSHQQKRYYRKQSSSLDVVLFVPNLLGYIRIVLALISLFTAKNRPAETVLLWLASSSLDLFDGILARRLKQTSTLGIYVDIAADNVLRTAVWLAAAVAATASTTYSASSSLRLLLPAWIISLEWCTMICTQLQARRQSAGTHWKHQQAEEEQHPWWIQQLFRNNFRNPLGCWAIYGLFGANMFWYASQHAMLIKALPWFHLWQYLAYAGRAISMGCEVYLTTKFLSAIIKEEKEEGAKE